MTGKLKGVSRGCKVRVLVALFLACALSACPTRPPPPPVPVSAPEAPPPPARVGQPYELIGGQSLLTLLVYRGGTLSSAGHNHVIASHDLTGTFYVPPDPLAASFEVHVPVASLTVDEPQLRAAESAADFPPEVSQGAREGTRRNMLGPALLDAGDYGEVMLWSAHLQSASPAQAGELVAGIAAQVRGEWHTVRIPLHYELAAGRLTVTGEAPLRQSELGLTPFTALMGALAVQDEMRLKVRLVARAAPLAR
jgi:hypothetical protein